MHVQSDASAWVQRWQTLVPTSAAVLDLACGRGRHTQLFAARGCTVTAVDRDADALSIVAQTATETGKGRVTTVQADLEGAPWPFAPASFDAIIVTNYLHRPQFAELVRTLRPGGVLIYETFMLGNERYGRPSNPEFLLRPGELLQMMCPPLHPIAFEQGLMTQPKPAMVQRLCAAAVASSVEAPSSFEIA